MISGEALHKFNSRTGHSKLRPKRYKRDDEYYEYFRQQRTAIINDIILQEIAIVDGLQRHVDYANQFLRSFKLRLEMDAGGV